MPTDVPAPIAVRVSTPCPMRWRGMSGDARVRFCGRCERKVYNLSAMSSGEIRALMDAHRANMCVRFFRRPDGTLVTADCRPATVAERLRALALPQDTSGVLFRLALLTLVLLVTLVTWVTVFGDNIRRMFGEPTMGMVGTEAVGERAPAQGRGARPSKLGAAEQTGGREGAWSEWHD